MSLPESVSKMNEFRSRPRSRFRAAMILAIAADGLQIFVFPLFAEGALSPADDVLDIAVAAVLVHLLGWHWEFLPAFAAELVPGVDLVPFWTIAVISVYRKWKLVTITTEETHKQRPAQQASKILRKPRIRPSAWRLGRMRFIISCLLLPLDLGPAESSSGHWAGLPTLHFVW